MLSHGHIGVNDFERAFAFHGAGWRRHFRALDGAEPCVCCPQPPPRAGEG
jgi:hypothetical protein